MQEQIDSGTLARILVRLQDVRPEDCSKVVSSLLPRLLPLANDPKVRDSVVAIITEALKRAKMFDCSISLATFDGLLGINMLPFACNFALVFLDTLDSLGKIVDVTPSSIMDLLLATKDHKLFSHQSNSLLFYSVKYSAHVGPSLRQIYASTSSLSAQALTHTIGDYYLDFCLIESSELFASVPSVPPGLSDVRYERLTARKKLVTPALLLNYKLTILDQTFLPPEYIIAIAVVCGAGSNQELSSKAVMAINRLKESTTLPDAPHITELLSSLFFGLSDSESILLKKRTKFLKNIRIEYLKYLTNNWLTLQPPSFLRVLITILEKCLEELTKSLSEDIEEKQLQQIFHLIARVIEEQDPLESNDDVADMERLLKATSQSIERWRVSILYSSNVPSNQSSYARSSCYECLSAAIKRFPRIFVGDWPLVDLLFTIAEAEAGTFSAGTFFHALGKLREPFAESSK